MPFHRVVAYHERSPQRAMPQSRSGTARLSPGMRTILRCRPSLPSSLHPSAAHAVVPVVAVLEDGAGCVGRYSQLDVPPIVQRLARGQRLQRLPRKRRQGWDTTCQVLIDFADSLRPFWTDFHDLRQRLAPLRGMQGLTVLALPDGDPEGRCWAWSFSHKAWQELPAYPLPTPGTPVLVLSDVGCNDATGVRRRRWRRLGLRLRQMGCQPMALMPVPRRWWDGEVTQLFTPVCWDRGARPSRRLRPYRAGGSRRAGHACHAPFRGAGSGYSCGTGTVTGRAFFVAGCRCRQ